MADGRDEADKVLAEKAFDALRAEVASLVAEVAGQSAQLTELSAQLKQVPGRAGKGGHGSGIDVTLGAMMRDLKNLAEKATALAASPLLALTGEQLGHELAKAAKIARREDQSSLESAAGQMKAAAAEVRTSVNSHRTASDQFDQNLKWGGWSALVVGLFFLSLWGPLIRATPDGWHWPEWMSARMLGKSGESMYLEAGGRLISASSPDAWRAMHTGGNLVRSNGKRLKACAREARKRGTAPCTVKVDREMAEILLAGLG